RAWSIPVTGVWLPFFTATNAAGETALAAEVLGAPMRLAREKDGTPKFSTTGRPVVRVVKDLSDQIRIVRENFAAGLMAYADTIRKGMAAEYKAQVEAATKAGEPIARKDIDDLHAYLEAQAEAAAPTPAPEPDKEPVAA
ncbi:MAG: hypothetical protein V3U31_08850, partial [Dehalococcoidia bacterium]